MSESIVFDRAADYYDATRGFPEGTADGAAQTIAKTGHFTPRSRILEIGIGTGRIALPLAPYVGHVCGLDLSRAMMQRLRQKQTNENIHLAQADARYLPFPANTFHALLAVHVFHLIPDWQQVIAEAARVLTSDGVVLHCWNERDELFDVIWKTWNEQIPENRAQDVGLRWERNADALQSLGWSVDGPPAKYVYQTSRTPYEFRTQIQNRIWSHTWRLSDTDLQLGLEAIDNAIATHFPDPQQPVFSDTIFYVQRYRPPA
jgi:ubiquinone/menaquinone biosynthesis C-methylase UbiE